jgi:hypothetical protein
MRFRYLVMLAALVLPYSSASAQNTLAAMISAQYRVAPVIPFIAFDPDSATAPLPGSTIKDVSQRTLDGIATTDLSVATVCTLQDFSYGKFRSTQGFRQTFPAGEAANKAELRLLFGFDDDTLAAIQAYEITVFAASFLTTPYNQLLDIRAQTRSLERCSGAASSATKTAIKPIVAEVAVVFRLARPFPDETLRALQKKFLLHSPVVQSFEYRLLMHRRLIALGMED